MAEQDLASVFAILLVLSSVLLLVAPLFLRLVRKGLWALSFIVAVPALVLATLGLAFVEASLREPILLAPVVAVVFVARVVSPSLAYIKVRQRVWNTKMLGPSRFLLFVGFLFLGSYVWYRAFLNPFGIGIDPILLSERLLMAIGTSFVFLRLHWRVMPKGSYNMKVVWIAAILFSFAIAVIAPYAFPVYGTLYGLSGLMGWFIGGAVVLKSR